MSQDSKDTHEPRARGSRYYPDGAADPAFATAMADLADALGATLTESRIRVYAKLLGDVPPEALYVAFRRAANERVYTTFPTVGELRRYVAPSEDDAGLLAWSALGQAVAEFGAYRSIEVEDAATAEAVKSVFGSWPKLCEVDEGPALTQKRQEFLAAYRNSRRVNRNQMTLGRLPGLCEQSGYYDRELPVRVGRIRIDGSLQDDRDGKALPAARETQQLEPGESRC